MVQCFCVSKAVNGLELLSKLMSIEYHFNFQKGTSSLENTFTKVLDNIR